MNGLTIKLCPLFFAIFLLLSCSGGGSGTAKEDSPNNSNQSILDNGVWREATPESVGLKSESLNQAFNYALADGAFTQAALVIKDGKLVYEGYRGITSQEASTMSQLLPVPATTIESLYGTRSNSSLATSWSMAKSFTSILIGIAEGQYISHQLMIQSLTISPNGQILTNPKSLSATYWICAPVLS